MMSMNYSFGVICQERLWNILNEYKNLAANNFQCVWYVKTWPSAHVYSLQIAIGNLAIGNLIFIDSIEYVNNLPFIKNVHVRRIKNINI